ncbi:MAG TPA: winged helix-turn-helix domain-containing protein [Terriglobales bacterium]|nr:winged helix-turn-helix domain-containing protein [Terriglobales bacterium]
MADAVQAVAKVSRFGDFEFRPHVPELRKRGVRLKLEPKPLLVLCLLLETPGEVVSRAELQKRLWPENTFVDFELGLNVAVRKLREALCDSADHPRYVETLIGSGYRFIGSVEIAPVPTPPPLTKLDAAIEIRAGAPLQEAPPQEVIPRLVISIVKEGRRRSWLIGTAVVLLFLLGGAGIAAFRWRSAPAMRSTTPHTLLVTSFENRTGEATLDGTLETAFASELSNSRFIKIAPQERVEDTLRLMRRPANTRVDAAIGREICLRDGDIQGMLTGRVEKLGGKYWLTVFVGNPANGSIIASVEKQASSPDRLLKTVHPIADALDPSIGTQPLIGEPRENLARVTTSSLDALRLYSYATQRLEDGTWDGDSDRVIDALKRAVQYDPQFASAHLRLAQILPDPDEREHLESAMRLSSGVRDEERLLIAGGYYAYHGDFNKAVLAYQEFLRRSPNDARALRCLLYQTGQPELAYRAADLRPGNLGINAEAWMIAAEKGDAAMQRKYYDRSIALLSPNALEDSPGASGIEFWPTQADLNRGDLPAVNADLQRLEASFETLGPKARIHFAWYLGLFYCYLGQFAKAEHWFSLTDSDSRRGGMAQLAYARGQPAARALLRRSVDDPNVIALLATLGDTKLASELSKDGSERAYYDVGRGIQKTARGERDEGIVQFREALAIAFSPDHKLAAANLLADALEQSGDFAGAADALAAATSSPLLPLVNLPVWATETRLHLAYLYRKLGRNTDADRIEHTFEILSSAADPDYLTASRRRVVRAVDSRWKSSRKQRRMISKNIRGCHLLRTSFASFGAGQQSVNVQFALSSDIDFAVHDEWNHKPHCQARAISGNILLAAVKFMRYVCCIESVQNRELIAGIPCLGFHQP